MNELDINSIKEALERGSDGWWAWEKKTNKAIISTKLCNLLNIETKTDSTCEYLQEVNIYWWKEYIKGSERNQEFFNNDNKERRSIETEYTSKTNNVQGTIRISKFLFEEKRKEENSYIFYVAEDVTNEARKYKQITEKAFSDNLTGLANRALFEVEIEKLSAERWRKNLSYSLFMIDIDNFKNLNDTNGHVVGDFYLKEISNR